MPWFPTFGDFVNEGSIYTTYVETLFEGILEVTLGIQLLVDLAVVELLLVLVDMERVGGGWIQYEVSVYIVSSHDA